MAIDVKQVGGASVVTEMPPPRPAVFATTEIPRDATVVGTFIGTTGDAGSACGGRDGQRAHGFDGKVGQTLTVPGPDRAVQTLVGCGDPDELDAATIRDAAGAFGAAAERHSRLAIGLPPRDAVPTTVAVQSIVEGALLARYRFDALKHESESDATPVDVLTIVVPEDDLADARVGAERGLAFASATRLARDLANTPHSHLSAVRMAELAQMIADVTGLEAEVFDSEQLEALGCGGLLGVNAGSVEPPRMIKLVHHPPASSDVDDETRPPHLAFVGKGVMYDSGGIALKPGDEVHAQMKNDMSGAGAVLAAMSVLRELGCTSKVTGYLMCTDNMPSGTAMALGDVITIRGGTTVEVVNTDAEGRLIMSDALVLATEESPDAIVDIATLTGACMRALGTKIAGVMGNDPALVDQVVDAADATDEPVWELPLEPRYRKELDSGVADIKNLGGANAGAITAALFLAEFVGDVPWAHIDIAGTANNATTDSWRTAGCTGFGARLLAELALGFEPPAG